MFKLNKNNNLVKKVLVSGAALLMFAGVGASASNVNIHASGFNLAKIEQTAKGINPQKESATGRYTPNNSRTRLQKKAYNNFTKHSNMVLNNNAKPAPSINRNCKISSIKKSTKKAHKHLARKARVRRTHRVRKARKHVARRTRKARKNTRGYKTYEVKNLALTLNRLDKKVARSHGRKRAKLVKNMSYVNKRLVKLAGTKHGNRNAHGYRTHEVKNLAITLNRVDKKARRTHGKKYTKLFKALKSCNHTLIKLAK